MKRSRMDHPEELETQTNKILSQSFASPVGELISLPVGQLSQQESYKILIGSIVPRPIALVSTVNSERVGNLAPFSFFNAVSTQPLCISISITRRQNGEKKDTLRNIESTGELVVNSVAEWMIQQVNHCSADYPYGVDEMQKVGLTPLSSQIVRPARVKESPVQFECVTERMIEIGDGMAGSSTLIIARVLQIHIDKSAYQDGRIMLEHTKPVSRLAGNTYARITETFDLARPTLNR
ncbi:MAG: flavin reductase family protein [Proteobacteria bacterium]|nr:MAG: flavin reductase family protein [Pseudomonadota bacterium]